MADQHREHGNLPRAALIRAGAALLVGLAFSAAIAHWHYRTVVADQRIQLERIAERTVGSIANELDLAGRLVRAVQAVFLSSDDLTDDEFLLLHQGLDADGGFTALRALAYSVRERRVDGADRYITRMIAPAAGNEAVLGLDVASQPANMRALERAIDSNRPVMSGAFKLLQQEGTEDRGVTIRLPVFTPGGPPADQVEAQLRAIGSLAASFDLSRLLATSIPAEALSQFQINVVDISEERTDRLFRSRPDGAVDGVARFSFVDHVRFGTRTWRIQMDALPEAVPLWRWPLLTLLIGLLASAMLALAVWSLAGTRVRIELESRRVAAQFKTSETRFRALNELLPAMVMVARVDDGGIEYLNRAGRRRLGVLPGQTEPMELDRLLANPELTQQLRRVGEDGHPLLDQIVQIGVDSGFWANLSVSRIELGGEYRLLAVASDVTELRELAERLRHQATHDELTGLYNRRGFEQALSAALSAVNAGRGPRALLYLDLDQFKVVNESSGHAAGDELLRRLATQLQSVLEPGDALARLGGDEFGVVLADGRDSAARASAEQVRQTIADFVFRRDGRRYPVSASLGLVFLDRPGMSPQDLLATADMLCFLAKEHGRNRVRVSSEIDPESMKRRLETRWVGQLREAMADDRIGLDFQKLVSLKDASGDSGVHVELLLHMRDDQGRSVSSADIVPAAERFGLMPQIDRWVVETALKRFGKLRIDGQRLATCAINLSGATVDDEHFADFLLDAIDRHQVPAERLCFEITETAAVGDIRALRSFMRRLRSVGCRFALDDFGTGMASFGYLRQLPVDLIKIDGSFIKRINSDPMSLSIVRAIVEIGHQAGLRIVAECVETEPALVTLRELGVDFAQGYLLHRPEPLPAVDIE